MVKRFAVIGNPISHSLSPFIHHHFAKQTGIDLSYEKIQGIDSSFEAQVSDFFAQNGKGINITLPYKIRAFTLSKKSTPRCVLAGAANTLWMQDGQLWADNTDGLGLSRDLSRYLAVKDKNLLILGAGGATRGIIHPLLQLGPKQITIANRSVDKIDELKHHFPQISISSLQNVRGCFDLVINATSASTHGENLSLPVEIMSSQPFCYDLAYKLHEDTWFVGYAKQFSCQTADGLGMLVEQAAEAFCIWNGVMPLTANVLDLLRSS